MCTKEWQFSPTTKSVLCKVVNSKCVPSVCGLRNVPSTQTQRSKVQGQTLSTYLRKFDTNYSHSVYPLTFNSWLNSHDLNDRTGHVARIGDTKGEYRILVRETWREKCHLENTWVHERIILKCIFKKIRSDGVDWSGSGRRQVASSWELGNEGSGSVNCDWGTISLSRRVLLHGVCQTVIHYRRWENMIKKLFTVTK